jgi:DNA-directed RNA polymerase specialized sigma24 family protein
MRATGTALPVIPSALVGALQRQQQRLEDTYHGRRGTSESSLSLPSAPTPTPRIVWSAIHELPQKQALVLRLRFGSVKRVWSYAEIAGHLGVSVPRVRLIESRALYRLRALSLAANGAGNEWDEV